MPYPAGARLGPYEIVRPIGAGGMGEVYLGRDTRLQREVAIKTLPDAFTTDRDRLSRFREKRRSWPRSITRTSPPSTALKIRLINPR